MHTATTWRERLEKSKRAAAVWVREATQRELPQGMAGVEPASAAQVQRLSAAMHRRMRELQGEVRSPRGEMQGKTQSAETERVATARDHPGYHRSWFKLFKHMDDDGSGKVAYVEFEGLVRHELQLTPKELPEAALKAVWVALDSDGSGHISVGEFGAFMRKGEPVQDKARRTLPLLSAHYPHTLPRFLAFASRLPLSAIPLPLSPLPSTLCPLPSPLCPYPSPLSALPGPASLSPRSVRSLY